MQNRTWKDNATEWVALGKQGKNVRLALLVACSVKRSSSGSPEDGKATVTEFAELVGTTPARIMRHLDAWNEAAKQQLCPPSNGLFPQDAARLTVQVPSEEQFSSLYDASKSGGRPRASVDEITRRIDMDAAYAQRLLDSIKDSHPGLIPEQRPPADDGGIVVDDVPHTNRTSAGGRFGTPNNEQRAARLNDRIAQLDTILEGLVRDIRTVQGSQYAATANVAQDGLLRVLKQYTVLIESRKTAA